MNNLPVNVQDYYRGVYTILCEEFVYSVIIAPFLVQFWFW
jgi:hypothetical protein